MTCTGCGAKNPDGMKFCGTCGASLTTACPACAFDNPAGFRFCGRCGGPLAEAPAPPASPDEGAERRQLTVLFCDLVSSTELSERFDPEVLREYQAESAEAIRPFGGHIAQYLGDGLLIYFGYPVAHEDDARRAVHAGLGILQGMRRLNERLERERGFRLAVRIGIHTGPVVAGAMGAGGRAEHLAVGQTPNIAARLQAMAAPDTVVLGDATYRLVHGFFECEPLGELALRGLSQATEAYRALHDTGMKSRFEVAAREGLLPLVGREPEQEALRASFARARDGRGQAVSIVGEGGIGKSRLVQMFQAELADAPHVWLLARCSPYLQQSALHPVIDLLQGLLGFQRDEPPWARDVKLVEGLAPYASHVPDGLPLLGALLSIPLGDSVAALRLAPERQRERTLDALLGILLRMSEEQPVVVVLEDAHWADPSTLQLLGLLVGRITHARVLVLATFRPEFTPSWALAPHATVLKLDRLGDAEIHAMIEHIARGKRLPPEVVQQLVAKTDGVPIFVEELTRMMLESDWLAEDADEYRLAGPLPSISIPTTLQDSLLARLDRLGTAKDVAQLASVLGREFTYEMLAAVSPADGERLRRDLDRLVAAELLYQRSQPPSAAYTFRHALIQDAAYGLLLTSTRQQHHRRVAETLSERFRDIVETQPELLAHHFSEAGLTDQAVGHWLRAGRRALGRSANVEASSHARRGLELLRRAPDSPERDALELALETTQGSAAVALKGYGAAEVERAFGRAVELCERLGNTTDRFRATVGLWTYYVVRAEYGRALELAEGLLSMAEAGAAPTARVHAWYCVGFTRYYIGEIAATCHAFEQAIAIECDDGDPALALPTGDDVRIHVLTFLAHALWHLGRPDEAIRRLDEAIALARRQAHPYGVAFALAVGASLATFLRDTARARALTDEGLAIAVDKGYSYHVVGGGFCRGWALAQESADDDGLTTMQRSLEAMRRAGARLGETFYLAHTAEACVRRSRWDEAGRLLEEAAAASAATGEVFVEPELHRLSAERAAGTGDRQHAEACFRRALEVAHRQDNRGFELRAAVALGRLWRDDGRRAEARELVGAIAGGWVEGRDMPDMKDAHALLDDLA